MEDNDLRKLQLLELEIFNEVINICKKYNLKYFLMGGTFLGAVRHKGFIPWDDDIDIGMPREDYERFLEVVQNSKYKLSTYADTSETVHYQAKLTDSSIKLINKSGKNEQIWSAWIDIFPLDGMPNNILIRNIYKFYLLYLRAMLKFTCFDDQVNLKQKNRPLIEKILIWVGLHTSFGKSRESIIYLEKIDKALKKYKYRDSKYVVNFMGAYKFKEMFKKEIYEEIDYYDFENLKVTAPKNYDAVLSQLYGNYMEIPKENDKNHHNTNILNKEE